MGPGAGQNADHNHCRYNLHWKPLWRVAEAIIAALRLIMQPSYDERTGVVATTMLAQWLKIDEHHYCAALDQASSDQMSIACINRSASSQVSTSSVRSSSNVCSVLRTTERSSDVHATHLLLRGPSRIICDKNWSM